MARKTVAVMVLILAAALPSAWAQEDAADSKLKIAFSASYHKEPGGSVSDYMSRDVQTVDASADIIEVAEMFVKAAYRRFPVMKNGQLVGQLSRHDILKAIRDLW